MTLRPEILPPRLNENIKENIVQNSYATPRHTIFEHREIDNKISVTELSGTHARNLRKLALIKTRHSVAHFKPDDTHPELFNIADEIRINNIFSEVFPNDNPHEFYNASEIIQLFGNQEQLKISSKPLILESARTHGTTAKALLHRKITSPEIKQLLKLMHQELRATVKLLKYKTSVNWDTDSLDHHIYMTNEIARVIQKYLDRPKNQTQLDMMSVLPHEEVNRQQWCKLAISLPKLEMNHNGRMNRKKRPHEMGRTPTRLHRLLTDPNRRIFSKKSKSLGGTVVIDCSGSMGLSEQQIKDIMQCASGSTIWAYSSSCRDNDIENCWLLAHKGKSVRSLPWFHGGNGVDLPALAHAYRTKRNRNDLMIWISDGRVTGNRDTSNKNLRIATAKFIRKFNIHHVQTIEQAEELLTRTQKGSAGKRTISQWERNSLNER